VYVFFFDILIEWFIKFFAYRVFLVSPRPTGESVVSESTLRGGEVDQETSVDKEGEGASTVASTEQSEAVTQETR
jgi:hypothetical protein